MPAVFRAYGQIRRGSGPWRTPFLIPTPVLSDFDAESHVSIDAGAAAPDLRISLRAISVDQYPTLQVQFIAQPIAVPPTDITLRMVLLMEAEEFFVDSGTLEASAGFVSLQYRVPPGRTFPGQLTIDLLTAPGGAVFDPADNGVTPAALTPPFPAGSFPVDVMGITVNGDPIQVEGGLVSGPMERLNGVRTSYNMLLGTDYAEVPQQIRGIDLRWADPALFPGAPLPPSSTWLKATASGFLPAQARVGVRVLTPTCGDRPSAAPAVEPRAGGALRPGSYRYATTWVHANGNESPISDRSVPVKVDGADRTVRVSGFPAPPPDPNPDPRGLRVTKRRVYRTDGDPSVDPTDTDRGDRGEDVFVEELALSATECIDDGPADPAVAAKVRTDLLEIQWSTPAPMDVTGSIRMIGTGPGGTTDETYEGTVQRAPRNLRVTYQPGRDPTLRWLADASTPALTVAMPALSTPFGTGLRAVARDLPTKTALSWLSLGSEHFALAAAGDVRCAEPAGADPASSLGRIGVQLGPVSVPPQWPSGDAAVVAEITPEGAGTPEGLFALDALRRGRVTSGAAAWAERAAAEGRVTVRTRFAAAPEHFDRTLRARIALLAEGAPAPSRITARGHFLGDALDAAIHSPSAGPTKVEVEGRARFLRSKIHFVTAQNVLDAIAFLDDTTSRIEATIDDSIEVGHGWPVRVGGTLLFDPNTPTAASGSAWPDTVSGQPTRTPAAAAKSPITIWPDVVVPSPVKAETELPLNVTVGDPGVGGRVAAWLTDGVPAAVRSNPVLRMVQHGDSETPKGFQGVTGRVFGVREVTVPAEVKLIGEAGSGQFDFAPVLELDADRPNRSLRVESVVRDRRNPHVADLRAPDGARIWLRARTASVPRRLTPSVRFVGKDLVGASIIASERWGKGAVLAEPGFAWDRFTGELGEDKGIGLLALQFDELPGHLEAWLLDKGAALDGKVDAAKRLPDVGPVGSDWRPGGVLVRLDDPLRTSGINVSLPGDQSRVCKDEDEDSETAVRHGNWSEVLSPFVELVPTSSGLKEAILWSASAPAPTGGSTSEPDPCADGDDGDAPATAMGWKLPSDLQVRAMVRMYDLDTPSGVLDPPPRWFSMPSRSENWGGEDETRGVFEMAQEIQMKEYGNVTVALYPKSSTDNPFGDWQGGDGTWWLRQRGGLDVPLIPFFWWTISSGDVFMGNVGGGYHMIGTNGIHSTLPKIFVWAAPTLAVP